MSASGKPVQQYYDTNRPSLPAHARRLALMSLISRT
jgi:hypothetical protein